MNRLTILLVILLSLGDTYAQEKKSDVVVNVSVDEFKQVMDSLKDEVLIDLRTPDELKQGKISGARIIDYFGADYEPEISGLDRNKTYLLYCAGGGRSSDTAELMKKLGFKKIYNLESGFNGWVKKKMPVSKE
jgi:rhodanese-related sulfurtransferase